MIPGLPQVISLVDSAIQVISHELPHKWTEAEYRDRCMKNDFIVPVKVKTNPFSQLSDWLDQIDISNPITIQKCPSFKKSKNSKPFSFQTALAKEFGLEALINYCRVAPPLAKKIIEQPSAIIACITEHIQGGETYRTENSKVQFRFNDAALLPTPEELNQMIMTDPVNFAEVTGLEVPRSQRPAVQKAIKENRPLFTFQFSTLFETEGSETDFEVGGSAS